MSYLVMEYLINLYLTNGFVDTVAYGFVNDVVVVSY